MPKTPRNNYIKIISSLAASQQEPIIVSCTTCMERDRQSVERGYMDSELIQAPNVELYLETLARSKDKLWYGICNRCGTTHLCKVVE